jgi:hypothetical protein
MKTITYSRIEKMEPRPGVKYATSYYKQSLAQREALVDWIRLCAMDIMSCVDSDREFAEWWHSPLKDFRKVDKSYRTPEEIVQDLLLEAVGQKRNGEHKDFAQAPIERWNRLWADTPWQFSMVESFQPRLTTFDKIMSIAE